MSEITRRAQFRWKSILPLLGVAAEHLTGKHGPCPMCGGVDRFRFDNRDGRGTWICTHCGAGDGFALLTKLRGHTFPDACRAVEGVIGASRVERTRRQATPKFITDVMNAIWRSSSIVTPADKVAGHYLNARGIVLSRYPAVIRSCEHLRYDEKHQHPGMVAKVTSADGDAVALHRTFLADDTARRLEVDDAKRVLGSMPAGCAVRLGDPVAEMGIAEGIETALSAGILFGLPVWAALNDSRLMAWEPPEGVTSVVIFGDNDQSFAGQAAAHGLAKRLAARKIKVDVRIPEKPGTDWNDVLRARS